MHLYTIDMPERDKLAAGYGRISDVFDYYSQGVVFPVFVDDKMEKVSLIPDGDEYIVYPGTGRYKGNGIRGTKCSLFSDVVDHGRDLLVGKIASSISRQSGNRIPQIA
jgi:hypothetical protein